MLQGLYISKLILNPKFGNTFYSEQHTATQLQHCCTCDALNANNMLMKKYEFIFTNNKSATNCNTTTAKKYQVYKY